MKENEFNWGPQKENLYTTTLNMACPFAPLTAHQNCFGI
jgi:hypothetical protein